PLSTPIHFSKICVQTHDTKTFSTALACHNSNFLTLSIYARHLHPEKASRVREPRGCLTNSRRAESVTCNQVSNRFFGQLAFVATVNHWTTYLVQSDFGLALSPVDRYPSGMSGKQPWSTSLDVEFLPGPRQSFLNVSCSLGVTSARIAATHHIILVAPDGRE